MTSAYNLYQSVINDVISSVRDSFLDESVDENVLQELRTLWIQKLDASKTIEQPQAVSKAQEQLLDSKMGRIPPGGMRPGASSATNGAGSAAPGTQLVITDPNRLVPVQITIPAQPGNPNSVPRALTVQVPAHALQQSGPTSAMLQQVLTQAITQALSLPESHAAIFLQTQINAAFKISQ